MSRHVSGRNSQELLLRSPLLLPAYFSQHQEWQALSAAACCQVRSSLSSRSSSLETRALAYEIVIPTKVKFPFVIMFFTPTPKEKELIKQLLRQRRHPAQFLRNFGVSFDLKDEPKHDDLLQMSTEDMSRFADFVIQTVAGDENLEKAITSGALPSPRGKLNTSALGGMAYLCLHGSEACQKKYATFLQDYKKVHQKEKDKASK